MCNYYSTKNYEKSKEENSNLYNQGWTILRFSGIYIKLDLLNCSLKNENKINYRELDCIINLQ